MRIHSVIKAWSDSHKDCKIPELPEHLKNKKCCEHCIKGQCLLTWIFSWFVLFTICLVAFLGYRWWTYVPPIEDTPPSTAPENAEEFPELKNLPTGA